MADLEVPVFTPSAEEFREFSSYVVKLESLCPAGAAIIRPPKGWRPRTNLSYNDIYELPVRKPIKQHFIGSKGVYYTEHHVQRSRRLFSFIQEADEFSREHDRLPPDAPEAEVEKQYWRNVTFRRPTYGADLPGTLFEDSVCKYWNLNHLNTILDLCPGIPGVSSPYLYLGQYASSFCFHTEDTDLYGINYLHYGAPKIWYAVPASSRESFEAMARREFPNLADLCPQFLRHKQCLINPDILKKYKIPYGRISHKQGTFMIVFPGVYHQGYNSGFNIAESINFATLKWLRIGSRSRPCLCTPDSVRLDFGALDRKLFPGKYARQYARCQREINQAMMDVSDPLAKRRIRSNTKKLRKKRRRIISDGYDDDGEEEDTFDTAHSNPSAVAREILSDIIARSMIEKGDDPSAEFDSEGFRYPLTYISGPPPRTQFVRVDALGRICGPLHGPVFDPVRSVIDTVIYRACEGRKKRPPPLEPLPMSDFTYRQKFIDENGNVAIDHLKAYASMLAMEQELAVTRALVSWIHCRWKDLIDLKARQKMSMRIARTRRLFAKMQESLFEKYPDSARVAKELVESIIESVTDDTPNQISAAIVDEIVENATRWQLAVQPRQLAVPPRVSAPLPPSTLQVHQSTQRKRTEDLSSQDQLIKEDETVWNYAARRICRRRKPGERWVNRRAVAIVVDQIIDDVVSRCSPPNPTLFSDISVEGHDMVMVPGKQSHPAKPVEKAQEGSPTTFGPFFDSLLLSHACFSHAPKPEVKPLGEATSAVTTDQQGPIAKTPLMGSLMFAREKQGENPKKSQLSSDQKLAEREALLGDIEQSLDIGGGSDDPTEPDAAMSVFSGSDDSDCQLMPRFGTNRKALLLGSCSRHWDAPANSVDR